MATESEAHLELTANVVPGVVAEVVRLRVSGDAPRLGARLRAALRVRVGRHSCLVVVALDVEPKRRGALFDASNVLVDALSVLCASHVTAEKNVSCLQRD